MSQEEDDGNGLVLMDIEDLIEDSTSKRLEKTDLRRNLKKEAKKKQYEAKQQKLEQEMKERQDNLERPKKFYNGVPGTQKICVKTFGCSHNISDSEFMLGQLVDYGYQIVDDSNEADLILVNSCTVKNPSQQSFMTIVQSCQNQAKPIVVAGCVPQGDRNLPGLENVSVIGVQNIDRVVEVVEETLNGNTVRLLEKKTLPSLDLPKIRKNNLIEIIPINAGCLGSCTYCKTKHARGKLGSYTSDAILNRQRSAISEGVTEIWLTSEDTGAYGRDINSNISELLRKLTDDLPGHCMLRIGMTNPPYILEHLHNIALILNHPRVFQFMHICVQSGNDEILDKMNREYYVRDFEQVCDYLIKNVPGITIATDIICGFPGETEEQFTDSLKLIEKYKFPVVNISQFYPRPGTPAFRMEQCTPKEKKSRSTALTNLIDTFVRYDYLVGTEQRIWLSDREGSKGQMVGHTKCYVKVVLPLDESLLGKQVIVKITEAKKWHIEGEIIDRNPAHVKVPDNYFANFKSQIVSTTENKVKQIIAQQQLEFEEDDALRDQRVQEAVQTYLNSKETQESCSTGCCSDQGGSCSTENTQKGCCGSSGSKGSCGSCSGSCNSTSDEEVCDDCNCGKKERLQEAKKIAQAPSPKIETAPKKKNPSFLEQYGWELIAFLLIVAGILTLLNSP